MEKAFNMYEMLRLSKEKGIAHERWHWSLRRHTITPICSETSFLLIVHSNIALHKYSETSECWNALQTVVHACFLNYSCHTVIYLQITLTLPGSRVSHSAIQLCPPGRTIQVDVWNTRNMFLQECLLKKNRCWPLPCELHPKKKVLDKLYSNSQPSQEILNNRAKKIHADLSSVFFEMLIKLRRLSHQWLWTLKSNIFFLK